MGGKVVKTLVLFVLLACRAGAQEPVQVPTETRDLPVINAGFEAANPLRVGRPTARGGRPARRTAAAIGAVTIPPEQTDMTGVYLTQRCRCWKGSFTRRRPDQDKGVVAKELGSGSPPVAR